MGTPINSNSNTGRTNPEHRFNTGNRQNVNPVGVFDTEHRFSTLWLTGLHRLHSNLPAGQTGAKEFLILKLKSHEH